MLLDHRVESGAVLRVNENKIDSARTKIPEVHYINEIIRAPYVESGIVGHMVVFKFFGAESGRRQAGIEISR